MMMMMMMIEKKTRSDNLHIKVWSLEQALLDVLRSLPINWRVFILQRGVEWIGETTTNRLITNEQQSQQHIEG